MANERFLTLRENMNVVERMTAQAIERYDVAGDYCGIGHVAKFISENATSEFEVRQLINTALHRAIAREDYRGD